MLQETDPTPEHKRLHETPVLRQTWEQLATWTMICVILLAIYAVLSVVFMIFIGDGTRSFKPSGTEVGQQMFSLLMVLALIAFPAYYGYQFALLIRKGMKYNDAGLKTEAFRYLKLNFSFYGILNIVFIGFFLLAMFFAAIV